LTIYTVFAKKYQWQLFDWVILEKHYHFLTKVSQSKTIPLLINSVHKTSAFHIKKLLNLNIKPFWYQYWDRCIRNEKHYFETATYILYNSVRHGYVDDVSKYKFSSFKNGTETHKENLYREIKKYKPDKIEYYKEIDDF